MKAIRKFQNKPNEFWANIKLLSQYIGYTERSTKLIKIPKVNQILETYKALNLSTTHLLTKKNKPTRFLNEIIQYFKLRADLLNNHARTNLLKKDSAKKEFEKLYNSSKHNCPLPMNKQKGEKRAYSYFTCMINMIIEKNLKGRTCDYDPKVLTTFTRNNHPEIVLSRRIDGAYPSTLNPKAIWEIKEYYYTTTFGSRVADGIYESLLDGYELNEVKTNLSIPVEHYLFVDDYRTWWELGGKSYLCRIIDMLHMGYISEVIFGKEIFRRIPQIVKKWQI